MREVIEKLKKVFELLSGKCAATIGERGGVIIGYTKSGRPIYDSYEHPKHKSFDKLDHYHAAEAHKKIVDKMRRTHNGKPHYDNPNQAKHHKQQANKHFLHSVS